MTTIELGAAPDELGLRLNTLAVGGLVVTGIRHTITIWNANTPTLVQASALTTALLTVAAAAANPDYTCEIRGLIRVGATGGPLNVEFASEVAVSAVTIQADASSWRRKSPDTDAPSSVPEHTSPPLSDVLRVLGKGGKVREVPVVHAGLLARLRGVEGYAFGNGRGGHLSPGHVSRLLSAAMPDGWTAHTLRHRMATVAYAGTRDLLAVGAVLGHSRPETTQRYVRLPDDALRAAMRAAA